MPQASFTQWEYFLARRHKKRVDAFHADADYPPSQPNGIDIPDLQRSFLAHIIGQDVYRVSVAGPQDLRIKILRCEWPANPGPGVGDDSVLIGKSPPGGVGNRSVVINVGDSNGNVLLNQGGTAIGAGARADHTSIAIGAGALAGRTSRPSKLPKN
jgi:hypothetical protein